MEINLRHVKRNSVEDSVYIVDVAPTKRSRVSHDRSVEISARSEMPTDRGIHYHVREQKNLRRAKSGRFVGRPPIFTFRASSVRAAPA